MRRTHSTEFKAKLVLEVFRGEHTLNEIAFENEVHPNMLVRWKADAINNFEQLFEKDPEFGYWRMNVWLNSRYGLQINHKAVYCHMQEMGIKLFILAKIPANQILPIKCTPIY